MSEVLLPAVLSMFAITRSKFNKWRVDGHIKSKLPKGSPGTKTLISSEAAFEIAALQHLTSVGIEPRDATMIVATWRVMLKMGQLPHLWVCNPLTGKAERILDRTADVADLAKILPDETGRGRGDWSSRQRPASALAIIDLREMVDRLNDLKTGDGKEELIASMQKLTRSIKDATSGIKARKGER